MSRTAGKITVKDKMRRYEIHKQNKQGIFIITLLSTLDFPSKWFLPGIHFDKFNGCDYFTHQFYSVFCKGNHCSTKLIYYP